MKNSKDYFVMPVDRRSNNASSTEMLAAIERLDITPPVGIHIHNWSYSPHKVSTGVHRNLEAVVLAVEINGRRALIASLDLGWFMERSDEERLRGALTRAAGLSADKLILTVTHTHAGPSISRSDIDQPGGHLIDPYLSDVESELCACAQRIFRRLKPVSLEWNTGCCGLAVNRDYYHEAENRFLVGTNRSVAADDTLLLGRLSDAASGELFALVANYAVHLTTLGGENALISPDLIGRAREVVATHLNVPLLFLAGACGDLAPANSFSASIEDADKNGQVLGHAILSVYNLFGEPGQVERFERTIESGAPLAIFSSRRAKPDQRFSTKVVSLAFATKDNSPAGSDDEKILADRTIRAARIKANAPEGQVSFPLTVWHVGAATIFAFPGEAYSELQTTIRSEFPDRIILFIDLANGPHMGYIAPEITHTDGRYPAWQTPLDYHCFETLLKACRKELAQPATSG